jgi:hypothetical protein
MLRKAALELFAESGAPELPEVLERFIHDSSPGIRQFARFWISRAAPAFDFRAAYRTELASTALARRIAAVLAGYHECGGRMGEDEYSHWLTHPSVRIRRAALKCYAAALPGPAEPILRGLVLTDSDPSLARTAFELLRARKGSLGLDEIESLLAPSRTRRTRGYALSLLKKQDKWLQLPILLRLLGDADAEFRPQVSLAVRGWRERFNRTWTEPAAPALIEAKRSFDLAGHLLSMDVRQDIRNLLSTHCPPHWQPDLVPHPIDPMHPA